MQPRSDPTKMKNSTQTTLPHFNFSVTAELNDVRSRLIILINEEINEANCMISNSAKLDHRTKQHTQFGVSESHGSTAEPSSTLNLESLRVTVPEIWSVQNRGGKKKKLTRAKPYSVPYGDR